MVHVYPLFKAIFNDQRLLYVLQNLPAGHMDFPPSSGVTPMETSMTGQECDLLAINLITKSNAPQLQTADPSGNNVGGEKCIFIGYIYILSWSDYISIYILFKYIHIYLKFCISLYICKCPIYIIYLIYYVYLFMFIYLFVYVFIYIYLFIYFYLFIDLCLFIYLFIYIYVFILELFICFIYLFLKVHIYIYILFSIYDIYVIISVYDWK